ncbi:MAG: nucleotide exchange factor GrpE [Planctomycetota bacterium]|nr:nucleotide exchange factor GrpE [Planctomycetota bacterium]
MKRWLKPTKERCAITEKPVPLSAWKEGDGGNLPQRIEQDIRGLMRQVAEASDGLSEAKRQHSDKTRQVLLQVIEVMDGFDRVFKSIRAKEDKVTPQTKIWIGNFRTLNRLLDKLVQEQGVSKIENVGQGFDPHWHKVAEAVADPSKPDGTIVEEVCNGYVWQQQVLRKTEVKVVRNDADAPDHPPGEKDDLK